MGKARKILKRVKAVSNIRTVTKTMEMVATARFRKSHMKVQAARALANRMMDMVADLIQRNPDDLDSPLIHPRGTVRRDVLLVLTANRGLAGGYNSSVLRLAMERYRQMSDGGAACDLHVKGKKGVQFLKFRKFKLEKTFTDIDYLPAYEAICGVAQYYIDRFVGGEISGLEGAYMQYASSGSFKPVIAQLLPMEDLPVAPSLLPPGTVAPLYEFLPSPKAVLAELLPATLRMKLYQCFLEAGVTEQLSRMTAMHAATDNAEEMIHRLTVEYNRARQAQITTELAEIMGGRAGIDQG